MVVQTKMDSRMRIKKPAGNADFLATIKDFDLVFWISKSNSFPKEWMLMYSVFNLKIGTITDLMFDFADYTLYFCIFPLHYSWWWWFQCHSHHVWPDIDIITAATVTESQALGPPQQCRGLGAATTRVNLVTAGAGGWMADSNRWLMESSNICK